MTEQRDRFWLDLPDATGIDYGIRTRLALVLMERWGTVAGKAGAHANLYEEKPIGELVARCFGLADAFYDEAERRGGIRYLDREEMADRCYSSFVTSSRTRREREKDAEGKT